MKVVVALAEPPLPEGGAPGRCSLALLRGLQAHGVDVQAIAARQHYAIPEEPPADLPVTVVPVAEEPTGWRRRSRRLTEPLGELARSEFGAEVRAAARNADVLHLDEIKTVWCDEGVTIPALAHLHFLIRRDRPWDWPWRRGFRELVEHRLAERVALRRHRTLVASSPRVAAELRRAAPGAEVVLAPLSLDPSLYPLAPLNGPPIAGIVGTAAWPPTAAAVRRLVERVWPRVREQVPEARLQIAGRGVAQLGLPAGDGVEIVGEVSSSSEFLRGLSVLLFPLARGSGMKVKVLESLATGLPVVTTPDGAEGIEASPGVIVETQDRALAAGAAGILRDEAARRELGAEARALFERHYAPVPATAPLVELYGRLAGLA